MENVKRIIAQSYHRNGSGSVGFVATLFESTDGAGERGTYLAVSMPEGGERELSEYDVQREAHKADPIRAAKERHAIEDFRSHTAVVHLEMALAGDIDNHNVWRGGDTWGEDIARTYRGRTLAKEFGFDPFDHEAYIEELTPEAEWPAKRVAQVKDDIRILRDQRKRLDEAIAIHEARLTVVAKARLAADGVL